MNKHLLTILVLTVGFSASASQAKDDLHPITSGKSTGVEAYLECDTVIDINGYSVHLIKEDAETTFAGLILFSDEMKKNNDKELLERIESSLCQKAQNKSDKTFDPVRIVAGRIEDFKKITPATGCSVDMRDAKEMVVTWVIDGQTVKVNMPVSYDMAKGGSRAEIENRLIAGFKSGKQYKRIFPEINPLNIQPYEDDKYILPGESYQKKDIITRNVYFNSENLDPVWNRSNPLESFANLFIYPSDKYGDIDVDLTVLKHEYGEKAVMTVSLNTLLSVCEKDGCIPFWGVEKVSDDGKLEGALFFLNKSQGYDHVVRVACDIDDIFSGKGKIKASASLYIPTNNVHNLFAPYVHKTEKERIAYE